MEILSTGEKIKRARIYKGITLKELCDDRISISKMSCIENGKVKPENWILEIVAEKLEIEFEYLIQDVRHQLEENLKQINVQNFHKDLEKGLESNLSYALEYKYFDIAFELMRKLFEYYLHIGNNNKIQQIITQYYELAQKNGDAIIIFYKDMATYFFNNKEYVEALTYYSKLRNGTKDIDDDFKGELLYLESRCYIHMNDYTSALKRLETALIILNNLSNDIIKGKLIILYNCLKMKLKETVIEEEINNGFKLLESDKKELAIMKITYGKYLFYSYDYEIAKKEMMKGLSIFPKDDKEQYNLWLNTVINILINYDQLDEAERLTEESLNIAINCDNNRLIEESYYLKAIIYKKLGNFIQAEMYMNLSLDALIKFGSNEQRYNRYIEMANMYYELGEVRESIKYFTLAMNTRKKF